MDMLHLHRCKCWDYMLGPYRCKEINGQIGHLSHIAYWWGGVVTHIPHVCKIPNTRLCGYLSTHLGATPKWWAPNILTWPICAGDVFFKLCNKETTYRQANDIYTDMCSNNTYLMRRCICTKRLWDKQPKTNWEMHRWTNEIGTISFVDIYLCWDIKNQVVLYILYRHNDKYYTRSFASCWDSMHRCIISLDHSINNA